MCQVLSVLAMTVALWQTEYEEPWHRLLGCISIHGTLPESCSLHIIETGPDQGKKSSGEGNQKSEVQDQTSDLAWHSTENLGNNKSSRYRICRADDLRQQRVEYSSQKLWFQSSQPCSRKAWATGRVSFAVWCRALQSSFQKGTKEPCSLGFKWNPACTEPELTKTLAVISEEPRLTQKGGFQIVLPPSKLCKVVFRSCAVTENSSFSQVLLDHWENADKDASWLVSLFRLLLQKILEPWGEHLPPKCRSERIVGVFPSKSPLGC